jgi:predicted nucleotidyltransferase component of viral defense system
MASAHQKVIQWQTNMLPRKTKHALDELSSQAWIRRNWYLAGGTALALQVGHRKSVDLDFFTQQGNFSNTVLIGKFTKKEWTTTVRSEGTVYGELHGAKVSFIAHPFFLPAQKGKRYGHIRVLDPADIAVMKIIAISQRGRRRDFVDLYWYIKHFEPLINVFARLPKQYPTVKHNYHHIAKSLRYFDDADTDKMPALYFQTNWKTVKAYFKREVPKMTREYFGLK